MASPLLIASLAAAVVALAGVDAQMSTGFQTFMTNQYGASTSNAIARPDLGNFGSFGGGSNSVSQQTAHNPVLIVPDGSSGNNYITSTPIPWARNYTAIRTAIVNKGWASSEVYAITWWDGKQLVNETLQCAFLGQIRVAIIAIAAYTQRPVNVIGYCLGDLLARKAIQGGVCVDTGANIGPSLASNVNHYVSVGAPNFGSSLCSIAFFSGKPVCNSNNGVVCNSAWLNDVNSASNPSIATSVDAIFATNDQLNGDAPSCSSGSGVCSAPGGHTGALCGGTSTNLGTVSGSDPHNKVLVGSTSAGIQATIVTS